MNSLPLLEVGALTVEIGQGARLLMHPFRVAPGERVGICGLNGSGKSSLLRILAGELFPVEGTIGFDGQDITGWGPAERARSGLRLLPQTGNVFPGLSVIDNLRAVTSSAEELDEAYGSLTRVLRCPPDRTALVLSGGERQTLALTMFLASPARLFLFDEPFAGLERSRADYAKSLVLDSLKRREAAAIIVDHDPARLRAICDSIYELTDIATLQLT